MLADRAKVKEKLVELLPKFKRKINRQVCLFLLLLTIVAEPRAKEPKLNWLPESEPKLRSAAPAPFYLPQTKMVAEDFFVNCYSFHPIT